MASVTTLVHETTQKTYKKGDQVTVFYKHTGSYRKGIVQESIGDGRYRVSFSDGAPDDLPHWKRMAPASQGASGLAKVIPITSAKRAPAAKKKAVAAKAKPKTKSKPKPKAKPKAKPAKRAVRGKKAA